MCIVRKSAMWLHTCDGVGVRVSTQSRIPFEKVVKITSNKIHEKNYVKVHRTVIKRSAQNYIKLLFT